MAQLSHPYMTTGKTTALTIWTFVGKVMSLPFILFFFNFYFLWILSYIEMKRPWVSLPFNMLSVCHSSSSKEQSSFIFMAVVTICSDFGAQENKVCHCFPIYLPWSDGTRCYDLSFLSIEFQAMFSLSSLTLLIKRLFSSSSLSAIRMVSSAYLRLLIFLLENLIPACDSIYSNKMKK